MKRIKAFLTIFVLFFNVSYAQETPQLAIDLMTENQIRGYLLFNEMAYIVDTLMMPRIAEYPASASPDIINATDGDLYVIPASPEGVWQDKENQLALSLNASWLYFQPKIGWEVSVYSATNELETKLTYGGASLGWTIPKEQRVSQIALANDFDSVSGTVVLPDDTGIVQYYRPDVGVTAHTIVSASSPYLPTYSVLVDNAQDTVLYALGATSGGYSRNFWVNTSESDYLSGEVLNGGITSIGMPFYMINGMIPASLPASGTGSVMWLEENGDVMLRVTAGGVTKTTTLLDFSEL